MMRPAPRSKNTAYAVSMAAILFAAPAEAGCGVAPEVCEITNGTYHIVLPAGAGDVPALMFLHGWGADGQGMLNMRGMITAAVARGYAVIAPDGTPRAGRNGRSWGFRPDTSGQRDEIAFLQAVRDDAIAQHGIDADRVMLGGFSIGGSMASYLACVAPEGFTAYVPVAGAFWHPLPTRCAGPVDLLHTHGWSDDVVPLEGRILAGAETLDAPFVVAQGDVWQAMQIWRDANGCPPNASGHTMTGPFWRRSWHDCDSRRRLDFALFNGGHAVPEGWTDLALDWFEAL